MNQYSLSISSMYCDQNNVQYPNLVVTVGFKVIATSPVGNTTEYVGNMVPAQSLDNFTPYEQLTEPQVISWVESQVDMQSIKDWLDQNLAKMEATIVQKLPPWITPIANTSAPVQSIVYSTVTSVEL